MKYQLSLSTNYVKHWGFWEAIRELIQNAFDQRDKDSGCKVEISLNQYNNLRISTSTGELAQASLLLGESGKIEGDRGSFGEGYKLALLVLSRLGYKVTIFNNSFKWTPRLEYDEKYKTKILNIYEETLVPAEPGVCFVIEQVDTELWQETSRNINETIGILKTSEQKGRIYVGGLYVCTKSEFEFGYGLSQKDCKLDRDRGTISDFDLSFHTSNLWKTQQDDILLKLIEDKKPDVKYLFNTIQYETKQTPAELTVIDNYDKKYGNSIPVSNQQEIAKAQNAGVKWTLVPDTVKQIIGKIRSIFVPESGGPLERLEKFLECYRWRMDTEMKCELDDIVKTLKTQKEQLDNV